MPEQYTTLPIPMPVLGLNTRDEPTRLKSQTPYILNMKLVGDRLIKRRGYSQIGINTLSGVGKKLYWWKDLKGATHNLAFTTTTAYKYNSGTDVWDDISQKSLTAATWVNKSGNIYYYNASVVKPTNVDENGTTMTEEALIANLNAVEEWWYGDDDSLGFDTVYIYATTNPSTRANGYFKLDNRFTSTGDRIVIAPAVDTGIFTANGGQALIIHNGTSDGFYYFEGATSDYLKPLVSGDFSTGAGDVQLCKEMIEFWNHFFVFDTDVVSGNRNIKGYQYSNIANMDDFTTGNFAIGTLTDAEGSLLRAIKFNQDMILYAEDNIIQVRYIGGTTLFAFPILVSDFGLVTAEAAVGHSGVQFFMGSDQNLYMYAGGINFRRIGTQITDYLYNDVLSFANKNNCVATVVPAVKKLYFFIPSGDSSYANRYFAFNFDKEGTPWEYGEIADDLTNMAFLQNESAKVYNDDDTIPGVGNTFSQETYQGNNAAQQYSDTRNVLGFPRPHFISSAGKVYTWDSSFQDYDADIKCVYNTIDLTIDEEADYFRTQFLTFSALSVIDNSTVKVSYSVNETGESQSAANPTWIELEDSPVSLNTNWTTHRLFLSVNARRIRFKFEQDNNKDFQIRSHHIEVIPKTDFIDSA